MDRGFGGKNINQMNVSETYYERFHGYRLKRVEPGQDGQKHYWCNSLSIFSIWKHEVLTKLGDVEVREEKPTKNSHFILTF